MSWNPTEVFPDCMMPDGAEPCLGYRQTLDRAIKAEAEIERLRAENAHLQFCLNSRDDFLGAIGQWQAYVDTLPQRMAGVPGGWSEKPSALEQKEDNTDAG